MQISRKRQAEILHDAGVSAEDYHAMLDNFRKDEKCVYDYLLEIEAYPKMVITEAVHESFIDNFCKYCTFYSHDVFFRHICEHEFMPLKLKDMFMTCSRYKKKGGNI